MLKLIKKHDWLEMKSENLMLKEEAEKLRAKMAELTEKVDARREKRPYCGKHCAACKHSYVTHEGIFDRTVYGCYLNAENECYLFTRKEVEEAGR